MRGLLVALLVVAAGGAYAELNPPEYKGAGVETAETPAENETDSSGHGAGVAGLNQSRVEELFLNMLNEKRRARGLQPVGERDVLTQMGIEHSKNMAEHRYLGHVEPDGDTIEDRYRERGLLPECNLPIKESDRYYSGAENAYEVALHSNLVGIASGQPDRITNERELARFLVEGWMDSKGHRKAMLVYSADQAGLGLATNGSVVYASLELC